MTLVDYDTKMTLDCFIINTSYEFPCTKISNGFEPCKHK